MRCEIDIKKLAYASAEGWGGRPLRPSLDPPLLFAVFESRNIAAVWLNKWHCSGDWRVVLCCAKREL